MLIHLIWIFAALCILLAAAMLTGWQLQRKFQVNHVPAWAGPLSSDDYDFFLEHLQLALEKTGLPSGVSNGTISIRCGETSWQAPVVEFALRCAQENKSQWSVSLAHQLDEFLLRSNEPDSTDFDFIKGSLRLQLGMMTGLSNSALIQWEHLEGIPTVLVLEQSHAVRTVHPTEAAVWNQPVEELYRRAWENLRNIESEPIERIELSDGVVASAITGASPFTASLALTLNEQRGLLGTRGAIIAVPTAHILLAYPIESRVVQHALFPLAWTTTRRWQEGPGSIAPRLYWYFENRFVHLPFELSGENFRLFPPTEFANMLASLRGDYQRKLAEV